MAYRKVTQRFKNYSGKREALYAQKGQERLLLPPSGTTLSDLRVYAGPGKRKMRGVRSSEDLLERQSLVLQKGHEPFFADCPQGACRNLDTDESAQLRDEDPFLFKVRFLNPLYFPLRMGNVIADERRLIPHRIESQIFCYKRNTIYQIETVGARIMNVHKFEPCFIVYKTNSY